MAIVRDISLLQTQLVLFLKTQNRADYQKYWDTVYNWQAA